MLRHRYIIHSIAEMVELVDTPASGAGGGNPVEVRVLFSAPFIYIITAIYLITAYYFSL